MTRAATTSGSKVTVAIGEAGDVRTRTLPSPLTRPRTSMERSKREGFPASSSEKKHFPVVNRFAFAHLPRRSHSDRIRLSLKGPTKRNDTTRYLSVVLIAKSTATAFSRGSGDPRNG